MPVTTNTRKLAALLGASGAGIATDGTLTSTAIGEVIVAGDIAAGAVGADEIGASAIPVKPHIQPGVLYPSYVASGTSNKLLDGTTAHSGAFGTAQSDGRSYYYTNINGSKPIKDPRIGAHFGSQRHKFKSIQSLEQESASHSENVYSVDGREWCRYHNSTSGGMFNLARGHYLFLGNTSSYIEVVGYFNNINYLAFSAASRTVRISLDGTESSTDYGAATVDTPLD